MLIRMDAESSGCGGVRQGAERSFLAPILRWVGCQMQWHTQLQVCLLRMYRFYLLVAQRAYCKAVLVGTSRHIAR
jgi:hypothetical protein